MPFLPRLRSTAAPVAQESREDDAEAAHPRLDAHKSKEAGVKQAASDDQVSEDVQIGVQKIEATTAVWTRWHLILAYILSVYLRAFTFYAC